MAISLKTSLNVIELLTLTNIISKAFTHINQYLKRKSDRQKNKNKVKTDSGGAVIRYAYTWQDTLQTLEDTEGQTVSGSEADRWFDIFPVLVGKKSPTLSIPGVLKVMTLEPASVKLYFKMVSSKDASSMTKV